LISHSAPLWPVLLPDPAGAFGRHDDLSRLLGLQGVTLLLGVIKDLDAEETVRLTAWLTEGTVRSRLLVALYPGCRTTTRELDRLRTVAELQWRARDRRLAENGRRSWPARHVAIRIVRLIAEAGARDCGPPDVRFRRSALHGLVR